MSCVFHGHVSPRELLTRYTPDVTARLLNSAPRLAVGLDPATVARVPAHTIVYQPCFEDATLSVGIFLFGPRTVMPLHNHPGMTVLSHLCVCTFSAILVFKYMLVMCRSSLGRSPRSSISHIAGRHLHVLRSLYLALISDDIEFFAVVLTFSCVPALGS